MSKRTLKKYLASLPKEELEEQMAALYDKFTDVKAYYNFIFNPKEDKLEQEAKQKISNEYFPLKTKKAKLRRSTAQKYIKRFLLLGVDPFVITEVMLYNIETAMRYSARRDLKYKSFYTSMLSSYRQAADYARLNGLTSDYKIRFDDIKNEAMKQRWEVAHGFEDVYEEIIDI